ncbi:methylated-DNA--[protein]-cysteine S-methyltransferase [soil metagenome]
MSTGYAVFDTTLGRCSLAWNDVGLIAVQFPGASEADDRRRLESRHPGIAETDPPPAIAQAITRIQALLAGGADDLTSVALDLSALSPFALGVYEVARATPPGKTITYGEIAKQLGQPNASREVGQSLGRNPWPIVVPCHRVLGADGKVGGFSAPGGVTTKMKLLEIERAHATDAPGLFDDLPLAVKPQTSRR